MGNTIGAGFGDALYTSYYRKDKMAVIFGKSSEEAVETARVVEIEGEIAKVRLEKNPACDGCTASGFCHPEGGERPLVEVANDCAAVAGDTVVIEVAPGSRIGSSLIVFGVPIVALVAGTALGLGLGSGEEESAIVGAIAGLAGGFLVVRLANRFAAGKVSVIPHAVRITGHRTASTPGEFN